MFAICVLETIKKKKEREHSSYLHDEFGWIHAHTVLLQVGDALLEHGLVGLAELLVDIVELLSNDLRCAIQDSDHSVDMAVDEARGDPSSSLFTHRHSTICDTLCHASVDFLFLCKKRAT